MSDDAQALDAADPLAPLRDEFEVADPDVIYLDGNSLGRLPRATARRLRDVVTDEWGGELVTAWEHWIDLPTVVGDELGTAFLGADAGQVLVADSTTVNLYKLAVAAVDANPDRRVVVTDEDNFPTDRYVLEGLARARDVELRMIPTDPVDGPDLAVLRAAVDSETALVCLSHVSFDSGARVDMAAANTIAHRHGALTLWDLSHSAGAIPVDLDGTDTDLAVGCTYKYLNAGPGAPGYLYVRREHAALRTPIWGWFGQREQFAMGPVYDPVAGVGRFAAGTPSVLGLSAVQTSMQVLAAAGIDRLQAKAAALTDFLIELADQHLAPLGFGVVSPRDPARRGAHVALAHAEAYRIGPALRDAAKVVVDVRPPDRLRVCPAAAYTRFADVEAGVERIRDLVARNGHRDHPHRPGRVT